MKNNLYQVKWLDIQSEVSWQNKDEVKDTEPAIVTGVYKYIGKGKAGEIFASEWSEDDIGNTTIIPKSNIKEVKKIG